MEVHKVPPPSPQAEYGQIITKWKRFNVYFYYFNSLFALQIKTAFDLRD